MRTVPSDSTETQNCRSRECGPTTTVCLELRESTFTVPPRFRAEHLLRWQKQVLLQIDHDLANDPLASPLFDLSPSNERGPIKGLSNNLRPRRINIIHDETGRSGKTTLLRALLYQNGERILSIHGRMNNVTIFSTCQQREVLGWTRECLLLEVDAEDAAKLDIEELIRGEPAEVVWVLTSGKLKLNKKLSEINWNFYEISSNLPDEWISSLHSVSILSLIHI